MISFQTPEYSTIALACALVLLGMLAVTFALIAVFLGWIWNQAHLSKFRKSR